MKCKKNKMDLYSSRAFQGWDLKRTPKEANQMEKDEDMRDS